MSVAFRNVDARADDDVATWPYEALVAVIDRGSVPDWRPIFDEMRRSPWGQTSRRVERYLAYREPDGVGTLFHLAVGRARHRAEQAERDEVARRVRASLERSGLTTAALARLVGTSASRFSTYATGRVVPSATMLLRIEATAASVSEPPSAGPPT